MSYGKWSVIGVSTMTAAAILAYQAGTAGAQQAAAPTTVQPVPSTGQPRPANSQPRPANPQPPASNSPGAVQPTPIPNQPTTPPTPTTTPPGGVNPNNPNGVNPNTVTLPNGTVVVPVPATGTGLGRYERPFAFQSPNVESRFVESSHRLVALESRLTVSNQALLKRLGDVRTQSPEKQMAGLMDVVQQMLLDQAQLENYLVQARTAWSGEMPGVAADDSAAATPAPATSATTGVPTTGVRTDQPQPR